MRITAMSSQGGLEVFFIRTVPVMTICKPLCHLIAVVHSGLDTISLS